VSTVKAHKEKASERLKVAQKLFRDGDYEDAVSRAYYAGTTRLLPRYP
jgi:uncharacterized protein (UPF0332 family)